MDTGGSGILIIHSDSNNVKYELNKRKYTLTIFNENCLLQIIQYAYGMLKL